MTDGCPTSRSNGPDARVARVPAPERARWAHMRVNTAHQGMRHGGSGRIGAGSIVHRAITAIRLVAMPLAAVAQPGGKVYRIGLLSASSQAPGMLPPPRASCCSYNVIT